MKRQLAFEFTKRNDYAALLTERVKRLESERQLNTAIVQSQNATTVTTT